VDLDDRVRLYAALADRHRLRMVDALALGDLTAREVADAAGVPMNLAAHHLGILERAGLIERRVSEGDRRRRYVVLRAAQVPPISRPRHDVPDGPVLFVCTHNSARSQFAAGLWRQRTGRPAASAGLEPGPRVHPRAIEVAADAGLDLRGAVPRDYAAVEERPALVVSVCDRAREAGTPFDAPAIHWSVPDPVRSGRRAAFATAFADVSRRVDTLATGLAAA
jgi:protein-tyrosine-phosphatase/DNA-binding transcriptional ArsR family regulator